MLSIPDTLSAHRATIELYNACATRALKDHEGSRPVGYLMPAYHYVTGEIVMVLRAVDSLAACRCFIRRAKAASRQLETLKKFERDLRTTLIWNPEHDEP